MNILHICITGHFTEGMTYQENMLADQHILDGHQVTIITDSYKYKDGKLFYCNDEDIVTNSGIRIIRRRYHKYFNSFFSDKIARIDGLYNIIARIKPDIIMYHSVFGQAMVPTAEYLKKHPDVSFYIDCHESFNNSGRNFISRNIEYRIIQKHYFDKLRPYVKRVFAIAYDCYDFLNRMYGIPNSMIEDFPLGGTIISLNEKKNRRDKVRKDLNIGEDDIVFMHSGKLVPEKRTKELLNVFSMNKYKNIKIIIVGSIPEAQKNDLLELISKDDRVCYVGWKNGDDLLSYLCASDIYIQPGTESATLQNALCAGCAVAVYPYNDYKYLLGNICKYIETSNDIFELFNKVANGNIDIKMWKNKSLLFASENLDYKKLATRLYS